MQIAVAHESQTTDIPGFSDWHAVCIGQVPKGEELMTDVILLIAAVAFFVVSIAYVEGLERI